MSDVLAITFPIFLLIAVGYTATVRHLTTRENIRGLGVFVIRFALPAMLFRALSQKPIREIFDGHYVVAYTAGSLIAFAVVFAVMRGLRGKTTGVAAVSALGSSSSNSGFIGFPIATLVVGDDALVALSMTLAIENLVMIPMTLALAESATRKGEPLHRILLHVLRRLSRNPMLMGIVAGGAASIAGWHPPAPLQHGIDLLANASTAAALFSIGGVLAGLHLSGIGTDVGGIIAGKLLLHPLAVFAVSLLLPPSNHAYELAMIVFAASPMLSVYAILSQPYGFEKPAAAALLGATTLSFLTLSGLLFLLR